MHNSRAHNNLLPLLHGMRSTSQLSDAEIPTWKIPLCLHVLLGYHRPLHRFRQELDRPHDPSSPPRGTGVHDLADLYANHRIMVYIARTYIPSRDLGNIECWNEHHIGSDQLRNWDACPKSSWWSCTVEGDFILSWISDDC